MVDRIKSKISSTAASGNRDKEGIKAIASSTKVSVATKFIKAATSAACNCNSSPSSVSLRKLVKALFIQYVYIVQNVVLILLLYIHYTHGGNNSKNQERIQSNQAKMGTMIGEKKAMQQTQVSEMQIEK